MVDAALPDRYHTKIALDLQNLLNGKISAKQSQLSLKNSWNLFFFLIYLQSNDKVVMI